MELIVVAFLGLWVTVCSLLAWARVRRDLRDASRDEDRAE